MLKLGAARMFGWILLILVVALLAYIRLAPSDPNRWHKASSKSGMGEVRSEGGYLWRDSVEGDGLTELRAIDAVAQQTPRTVTLKGSIEEGQITYVTRSQWMGFPDYTTVGIYGEPGERYLEIHARLRFGRSDFGVNGRRVEAWRAAIQG